MKLKVIIPLIFLPVLIATVVPVVFYTIGNGAADTLPPPTEDEGGISLEVNGPKIYLSIDALKEKFGNILGNPITQTTLTLLVSTVLLITIAFLINKCIKKRPGKFQVVVEKLVTMLYGIVEDTMGKHNLKFAPYIGTLFLSSFICSMLLDNDSDC